MSLWNRTLSALGLHRTTGDVALEGDRIVLRDLKRAKVFPQEPKESGRKEMAACERCAQPLRRVVFTTAGSGDQVEIWRQYPLALDGWVCAGCGWSAVPRFISAEESTEYGRAGAEHASKGQFDDAEFWFRRIIGSWPGYAAGYADLGQLSFARAEAASALDDRQRHRRDAESWLRRAVDADQENRLPAVRVPLARTLALNGNEREALALLDALLGNLELPHALRSDVENLSTDIREGRALFSRATEMARGIVLEHPSKALASSDRKLLQDAGALLRQAADRNSSFANRWYIGKIEMRLRNMDAALVAFREAHSIDPQQSNGCRELCSVYLELDRAEAALPMARRALELRPNDAGLHCNLALVVLLTGDVDGSRAEAQAALAKDPTDAVTHGLIKLIDDVIAGRRSRPRSLAEAEGRKR